MNKGVLMKIIDLTSDNVPAPDPNIESIGEQASGTTQDFGN